MSKKTKATLSPISTWNDRVGIEVSKIRQQKKFRQKDDQDKAWGQNRKKIECLTQEIVRNVNLTFLENIDETQQDKSENESSDSSLSSESKSSLSKTKPSKKKSTARIYGESKKMQSQSVTITAMPKIKPPPPMSTWAPILRNKLFDHDEQQSNIPYFGDDVIDKDNTFIAALVEDFNAKITSSDDNMDDELFLDLVKALQQYDVHAPPQPYLNGTKSKDKLSDLKNPNKVKKDPPDSEMKPKKDCEENAVIESNDIIFQAISTKYPEMGSAEELIHKYKTLTAVKDKCDFTPDIDGPDATSVSCERALHSYKSLLCRRCFLYDCDLHNDDPPANEPIPRKEMLEELPLPSEPCGEDCFMNIPGVRATLSPRTPVNNAAKPKLYNPELAAELNPLNDITGTEDDVWTGAEQSMFRVLIKTFPANFCAIAQCMITKKCRQVYDFSLKEDNTSVRRKKTTTATKLKKNPKSKKRNQLQLFKAHSTGGERENSHSYSPCHHPGKSCTELDCTCREANNFCEKFCYCPPECKHRFPGCRCKSNCTSKHCPCYLASRECDPDLCNSCLDGKLEFDLETNSCRNIVLQRRMGKKLTIAPSDIAGWGCFIGEPALKNEFIAEYVGEMISNEEADKRGLVYDKSKCSYMFTLNKEFLIDAARVGGKIRFANHADKPNCKVKILLVNGDYRIGIYAAKSIDVGEELFFDYGKDFQGHGISDDKDKLKSHSKYPNKKTVN